MNIHEARCPHQPPVCIQPLPPRASRPVPALTDSGLNSALIGPAALGNAIATPGWLPSNSPLFLLPRKPKPVIHRLRAEMPLCRGVCVCSHTGTQLPVGACARRELEVAPPTCRPQGLGVLLRPVTAPARLPELSLGVSFAQENETGAQAAGPRGCPPTRVLTPSPQGPTGAVDQHVFSPWSLPGEGR